MIRRHNGNYTLRVTATGSDGVELTVGLQVNADAFDALKDEHSFDVKEGEHFLHTSDKEYYRINKLTQDYLNQGE